MAYLVKRTIKRIIRAILCLLSVVFIMSHNVGAINLTQEVYHIRGNMIINASCINCSNITDIQGSDSVVLVNNNKDLNGIIRNVWFAFPDENLIAVII